MSVCNKKFHSEYARVKCETVHIDEFNHESDQTPYCPNGHVLVPVQGAYNRWHYRHKSSADTVDSPLSDWHAEWQSHFEHTEVVFTTDRGKGRRADAVEDCFVIEIQHSRIEQEEVTQRTLDYLENGKKVLWIIDGDDVEVAPAGSKAILTFKHDWKYSRFIEVGPIYLDVCGQIYKIVPQEVHSLTVTAYAFPKALFIDAIKNKTPDLWSDMPIFTQNTLTVKQQGAGNGKTYGLIRMLSSDENTKYSEFIYVTKQHSAKSIIFSEFIAQERELGFTNVRKKDISKKYIICYTNKVGVECTLTISTIDSFMFAVGRESSCRDMFEGILNSVVSEHLKIKKNGSIAYAGTRTLSAKTLFVVDETQDLSELYAKAIAVLMRHTNMDVYVVGDMLQSIANEINAFSYFNKQSWVLRAESVNICRRFTHPKLVQFVNHMTPFAKWELPPVQPYEESDDSYNPLCTIQIPCLNNNDRDVDIHKCVEWIFEHVKAEVNTNNYGPENFLIVTPWVKPTHCELLNALEIQLQSYWIGKMKDPAYRRSLNDCYWHDHDGEDYNKYCVIHRSELGSSINLGESTYATRCVSIHSAKGDGREVVFLIDPSDFKLSCFNYKNSLSYDSMLHVAITRMKTKLYILYNKDSIGEKIMAFEGNKYGAEQSSFRIGNTVSSDMLKQSPCMFDVHKAHYSGGAKTEIVDMSHHYIRAGIMKMRAMRYLLKYDQHNQIITRITQLHHPKLTIKDCDNGNQYLTELAKNNFNFNMKPEMIESWRRNRLIPYLTFPTKHFTNHSKIVGEMITRVRNKDSAAPMCPMECIVEYYMYEVFNCGTRTKFTINDLYEITNIYSKSFLSSIAGHDGCCCKTHFDNTESGTLTNYLTSHYDRMVVLEQLVGLLCGEFKNANWNVDRRLSYSGNEDSFVIKTCISFVGHTDTDVVAVYLVPNLSSLNYSDYVSIAVIDRFIIEKDTDEKYAGKQVKMYLLALNEDKPHLLPEFDPGDVANGIKASMHSFYSKKHVEVRLFFNYWMNHYADSVDPVHDICREHSRMSKDANRMSKDAKNAPYIDLFFKIMEKENKKSANKAMFVDELKETFMERLDSELNDALDNFFE